MEFQKNIQLSQYSNYKIGGPAKLFIEVKTQAELIEAIEMAQKLNEPIFILGGGYNLLISDNGFNGVVIRIGIKGIEISEQHQVTVGAGVLVKDFLDVTLDKSLSGWEWAGGLPSTMGGAIWGNAGAFGGETKDRVVQVTSYDPQHHALMQRTKEECAFGYRMSIFKQQPGEIVLSARFQLEPGEPIAMKRAIEEKKEYRRTRQPIELPNIGSIFKNIPVENVPADVLEKFKAVIKHDPFPVLPVAALSADAGLKEFRVGNAQVSPKHPNFIVNLGGATASEVKEVMQHVRKTIKEKYRIDLEQEVIFVGPV
jgi:UDP-N-acetylmuramate dehydrogenase